MQYIHGEEYDPEKEIHLPSLYNPPFLQATVSYTFTPNTTTGTPTTSTPTTTVNTPTTTINSNVNNPGTINTTIRRPVTGGSSRNYFSPGG